MCSSKLTAEANTDTLRDISGYRPPIVMQIPPMDSLRRDHSFEPLNVPFAPFLSYLPHTFTPGRNFGPLTPS